ncbi:predicted protein, partial [Nematostella vectensis]
MKRRSIDPSKLRRPLKRSRITESIYGSVFLYVRFFLVWILVLTADFLLEFRFEYLWPFWLLLRSAYDSFKYQGLAFSLLFLTLAFCSDLICLVLLPVHWLFFAASTYVWVQFVWHTDRGLCLPTVSLWLLFVYVEASVRLRELKSLPFHLDLCRPFAAHCIGYPVVTLGYGVKSYVGYKMRQRKMLQVSKENEFYMQLINQALPTDASTGVRTGNSALLKELDALSTMSSKKSSEDHNLNELEKISSEGSGRGNKGRVTSNGTLGRGSTKMNGRVHGHIKDTSVILENDLKRVKVELQASRQTEQELRSTMHSLMANERSAKVELSQLKAENDSLQHKIQSLTSSRQQDRSAISSLERKLKSERDARLLAETQLREDRKRYKAE